MIMECSPKPAGKLRVNAALMDGRKFGYLTVVDLEGSDGKHLHWRLRCVCGSVVVREGRDLRKQQRRNPGSLPSCGCMTSRTLSERGTTHGMSKHPAYAVWRSMIDRCRLPTHQAWKNYGARGIRVCERWQQSFENFWDDMGATYRRGLDLDRENNDLGYDPLNCRWVTRVRNSNNRRSTRLIHTPWGEMSVSDASRKAGIGVTTLLYRISRGVSETDLFSAPDHTRTFTTS